MQRPTTGKRGTTLRHADRQAIRPRLVLTELLDKYPAAFVLESMARAVELRALPADDDELADTLPAHVAAALRRLAAGVEAVEHRRRLA